MGDQTDDGATRVVELSVASPAHPDDICAALTAAGVTPADSRTRVELVVPDAADPLDAVILYTTLAGFLGRFLPARIGDVQVEAITDTIDPGPKPAVIADELDIDIETDASDTDVHYARKLNLNPAGLNAGQTVQMFVGISQVRARPQSSRLPNVGDTNLEEVRRTAALRRAEARHATAATHVDKADVTPRLARLQAAATHPIAGILTRLGTTHDEAGENWHCPRPDRHSNGDQNPSMRIVDEKIRCFRCDPEWIDSLRVVMDTLNLSPDEAADWIESGESRPSLR